MSYPEFINWVREDKGHKSYTVEQAVLAQLIIESDIPRFVDVGPKFSTMLNLLAHWWFYEQDRSVLEVVPKSSPRIVHPTNHRKVFWHQFKNTLKPDACQGIITENLLMISWGHDQAADHVGLWLQGMLANAGAKMVEVRSRCLTTD